MDAVIESLRRLYRNDRINKDRVSQLYSEGSITREEYEYILDVKEVH